MTSKTSQSQIALAQLVGLLVIAVFVGQPVEAQTTNGGRDATGAKQGETKLSLDKQVAKTVTSILGEESVPGLIAAIADVDGIISVSCDGIRKTGSPEKLTETDRFHIGSCTKAMTSTMLATLVADGKLSWETTLIETFPKLKDDLHSAYHGATLGQLVRHRAGIPANPRSWWVHGNLEVKARRIAILKENLKDAPITKPGDYLYSNLGYMIAGSMAERVTGKTWEALMRKRLFEPLGMKSAGFGPPGALGRTDEPWGHVKSGEKWQAKYHDNAEALGPAGRVHCSLQDWAKFAALQLPASKPKILDRKTLNELLSPTGNYAAGWTVVQRPWAKGTALSHSGSNTMWFATVWVAPKLNRTFIAVTNSADEKSPGICDKTISQLIRIDAASREE